MPKQDDRYKNRKHNLVLQRHLGGAINAKQNHDLGPQTRFEPTQIARVDGFPRAKGSRDGSPRKTIAHNPENGFE